MMCVSKYFLSHYSEEHDMLVLCSTSKLSFSHLPSGYNSSLLFYVINWCLPKCYTIFQFNLLELCKWAHVLRRSLPLTMMKTDISLFVITNKHSHRVTLCLHFSTEIWFTFHSLASINLYVSFSACAHKPRPCRAKYQTNCFLKRLPKRTKKNKK